MFCGESQEDDNEEKVFIFVDRKEKRNKKRHKNVLKMHSKIMFYGFASFLFHFFLLFFEL